MFETTALRSGPRAPRFAAVLLAAFAVTMAGVALPAQADPGGAGHGPPEHAGPPETVRFATFNASLYRDHEGELVEDLSDPGDEQAQQIAEVIQRVRPDVLLLNEFDYVEGGKAVELFQQNYLGVSQNGAEPIHYEHYFIAPVNTGVASGYDLNNDGVVGTEQGTFDYANDAFGFGLFPGQYGMVVLSQYPIDRDAVRTFQEFLWKDMPGALLPDDPTTPEPADWYSEEELSVLRLSSKSHWDVPIEISGRTVHFLVSHPTPPVFDGEIDYNKRRNHDEIRFWSDYVMPSRSDYIYDDSGEYGGLPAGAAFVIAGDQNADPYDGDSADNAARLLLDNPRVNDTRTPSSQGAVEATRLQGGINLEHQGNPAHDTADFGEPPGNLRVDYVLPSKQLRIADSGVFWPTSDSRLAYLADASDHHLVWVDLRVQPGGR